MSTRGGHVCDGFRIIFVAKKKKKEEEDDVVEWNVVQDSPLPLELVIPKLEKPFVKLFFVFSGVTRDVDDVNSWRSRRHSIIVFETEKVQN